MSRLLLLAAFVTMALTAVPACDSSDSEPDANADGDATTSTDGGKDASTDSSKDVSTIVCHCPGSCGIPAQDVEWPASRGCGNGACDGISNCAAE